MSTTQVREKPIIFSGEMVRAILSGSKTQTRRVVKPQPVPRFGGWIGEAYMASFGGVLFKEWGEDGHQPMRWSEDAGYVRCPYGEVGGTLWVREAHYVESAGYQDGSDRRILYRASTPAAPTTWTPSIHMPRWASRITLEITGVRVERLQSITEADAKAEGAPMYVYGHGPISASELSMEPGYWSPNLHRDGFADLWDSINAKKYPWASSPWVWVLTFDVVRT